MKRREFVGIGSSAAFLPFLRKKRAPERPNIVFIFADQLRSMELGCYGGNQVPTPNMDRLAKEGARFSHAFSTSPVCSPYRAMLMTGNFPMKNGMLFNDHFLRNPTPYFAQSCKTAGYRTGYIGKWHLDGRGREAYIPPERRLGFDYWRTLECTHDYFNSKYYYQDEKTPRIWEGYDADAQTTAASSFIEEQNRKDPFCLFLSWGPPHDPYIAPEKYMERFPQDQIRLRENVNDFKAAEEMWNACDTGLPERHQRVRRRYLPKLKDPENRAIKEWYQGYYAAIAALDEYLGRVLLALEENGILDQTLIVLTSDHGDNLGSHRQVGKQLPYEESISIPFLVRYPEKIPPGTVTDALLAPVDVMPTLLSLAGISCPPVDGKDISGAAMGRDEHVQDAILIMRPVWLSTNWITNGSGPWRGVRTKRYTYARKSDTKKPWLLFDNRKDPYQLNNLANDPAYAALVKKLDTKTDGLLSAASDPETPETIAQLIYEEHQQHGKYIDRSVLFPPLIPAGAAEHEL